MPLQWMNIELPFGLGVDQGVDERVTPQGELSTLLNARFDKDGRLAKRPGTTAVTGVPLAEEIAADDNFLYTRAGGYSYVSNKFGYLYSQPNPILTQLKSGLILTPTSFANGPANATTVDTCESQDGTKLQVLTCMGTSGNQAFLTDMNKEDFSVLRTSPTNAFSMPMLAGRVFANNATTDSVCVVGTIATHVNIFPAIAPLNATYTGTLNASVTIAINIGNSFDAVQDNANNIYVLSVTSTNYRLAKYSLSATSTTLITSSNITVTNFGNGRQTLDVNSAAGVVGVIWSEPDRIQYQSFSMTTLVPIGAVTTVVSRTATWRGVTMNMVSSVTTNIVVSEDTTNIGNRIEVGTFATGGGSAIVPGGQYIYGSSIASRVSADKYFVANSSISNSNDLQTAHLVYNFSNTTSIPTLAGRINYGNGAYGQAFYPLPNILSITVDNKPLMYSGLLVKSLQNTSATVTQRLIAAGYILGEKPSPETKYPSCTVNGKKLFGGGYLHSFDPGGGSTTSPSPGIVANGFLHYPGLTVSFTTSGGVCPAGSYSFVATYQYIDSFGNVQESAPSVPVTIAVSTTVLFTGAATPYVAEPRRSNIQVNFYRTQNLSQIWQLSSRAVSNQSSTVVTAAYSTADAALATASILLQNPNADFENAQPDAPLTLVADQDRVWTVQGSSRNNVNPSKPISSNGGVVFYPDVFRAIDAGGSDLTAIARMDGKLFAFKEEGCFVAQGEGPDNTGSTDNLSDFQKLYPNVGAESHLGVLQTNTGVYVKSPSDIFLIGRDLQLARVGKPVEDMTDQKIRNALYLPESREVRFLLGNTSQTITELVRNEELGQWSVSSRNFSATGSGSAVFDEIPYYVLNGQLAKESTTSTTFSDVSNASYTFVAQTAWIKPSGYVQGYASVRGVKFIGQSMAPHTLQVRVRYNYSATWSESFTISSTSATLDNGVWQPEVLFANQKCESFQLEITDMTAVGEAFRISGMIMEVGLRPGSFKQSASKRMT